MTPSAKRHKRNRSSGDLSQSLIVELETLLMKIEGQVGDLKRHSQFGDLEEVQSLAKITETVCFQVRYVKELKAKDSNPNAMVVPLSNIDHNILEERLGIKLISNEGALQDSSTFDVIHKVVHDWDLSHLSKMLEMHSNYVNKKSEASARMVIDNLLMSCLELAMNANERNVTVLIPELLVWSSQSQNDKPPRIAYGNPGQEKVTYLSGSVDYATLNIRLSPETQSELDPLMDDYISRLINGDNAARALSLFQIEGFLEHTITLHEAKRKDKVLLSDHAPQAVAQCVALSTKIGQTELMPFTLTSGRSWIFGIVNTSQREYSITAEVEILDEMSKAAEKRLRALMELILIWVCNEKIPSRRSLMRTIQTTQPANVLEAIMKNGK